MNRAKHLAVAVGSAVAVFVVAGGTAISAGQTGALVRLQSATPGTAQTGNMNISGVGTFGQVLVNQPSFAAAVQGLANGTTNAAVHPGGTYWPAGGEFAGANGVIGATIQNSGYGVLGLASGSTAYAGVFNNTGANGAALFATATQASTWAMQASGGAGAQVSRLSINASATTYPLQFAPVLGDKISLWGATPDHYGFGIQNSLLQIHSDVVGSDVAFGYGSSGAFTETMRVRGNGNVGIGVLPTNKLQVAGRTHTTNFTMTNGADANSVLLGDGSGVASWGAVGNAQLAADGASLAKVTNGFFSMSGGSMAGNSLSNITLSDPSTIKVQALPNTIAGGGIVRTFGPNGNVNSILTFLNGTPNNGYLSAADSNGATQAGLYVSAAGLGIVFGDTKSFLVPDPDDDTKNIMYACVEGPEAAMYTRGTARLVNGEAHIDLPDHFRKLAAAQGITVILTPKSRGSLGMGFENESPSGFDVFELNNGKGSYEFAWEIKAVRKGHENWQVERPWDEALPGGDKAEQWKARLKSIEARRNKNNP